jgi:hypothetical protein
MSTLVPGLGKVHASEWRDGVFNLLLIAAASYGFYNNYQRNGLDHPWTVFFGGLTVGLYSGSIYGSYQSAKRTNKRRNLIVNEKTNSYLYSTF